MVEQVDCELLPVQIDIRAKIEPKMDIEYRALKLLKSLEELTEKGEGVDVKFIRHKYGGKVEIRDDEDEYRVTEYSVNKIMITPSGLLGMCIGFSVGYRGKLFPWFLVENDCGISCFDGHLSTLIKSGYKFPYN